MWQISIYFLYAIPAILLFVLSLYGLKESALPIKITKFQFPSSDMRIVNKIPYTESPDCERVLIPCNTNFVNFNFKFPPCIIVTYAFIRRLIHT
jgi:hypothetical protein